MDSFIAWLFVSLTGGFCVLLYNLWNVYVSYKDGKFEKQIKEFQNQTDLGESKIHENIENMSNADLANSARDIASAIRKPK